MLRRGDEGGELLAALGEKHPPRRRAERPRGLVHRLHLDPAVAGLPRPGRARQGEQRDPRRRAGLRRVARHLRGEGMGRVDHRVDPLGLEKSAQPPDAAEAAAAHGDRRRRRRARAPGERQDRRDVGPPGERGGERARFGRAAEEKKAHRLAPREAGP